MKKKICILGSTGSIGVTTLDILLKDKKNFDVLLLSANENSKLLLKQANVFKPKYIYTNNLILINKIKNFCKKKKILIIDDINSLKNIKFDITVSAISGISGLIPTINIIKFSKKILIANKESIICGWKFINKELIKFNCSFVPIDSEHFSIFKLIKGQNRNFIKKIYLTASGGPFFKKKIDLKKVTPSQAIKHPNWKMGKKISIDSANLMNKILEIIEASLIFNIPINKFSILVHPESLIHALIEYNNGLSTMMYHHNNMKIPISNAIYENFHAKDRNNLSDYVKQYKNRFSFYKVNEKKFPAIKILKIKSILNEKGFILINSVNEILVNRYINKHIQFPDIVNKLLNILQNKDVKKYLINNRIHTINNVFKVYNFCKNQFL